MSTVKDFRRFWLQIAIDEAGSAARLAEVADLNPAYISQVKNQSLDSKTKNPKQLGDDAARRIEAALKKQVGWMDQPPHLSHELRPEYSDANNVIITALANKLGAGRAELLPFDEVDGGFSFKRSWLDKRGLNIPSLRVLDVIGDSMEPYINDGDVVLVDTSQTLITNAACYALRDESHAMVKRLFRQMDCKVRVESDNPKYPPDYFTPDREGVILGRVVWRAG